MLLLLAIVALATNQIITSRECERKIFDLSKQIEMLHEAELKIQEAEINYTQTQERLGPEHPSVKMALIRLNRFRQAKADLIKNSK